MIRPLIIFCSIIARYNSKRSSSLTLSKDDFHFQIVPVGAKRFPNITLWCFNKDTGLSSSETFPLDFDASLGEHDFRLDYIRSPVEGWDARLMVDGRELVTMSGGLLK